MFILKHVVIALAGFIISLLIAAGIVQLSAEAWGYGIWSPHTIHAQRIPILGMGLLTAWFLVFYRKLDQPRLMRYLFMVIPSCLLVFFNVPFGGWVALFWPLCADCVLNQTGAQGFLSNVSQRLKNIYYHTHFRIGVSAFFIWVTVVYVTNGLKVNPLMYLF